jgi:Uncharacterized vancomycin resistance protein
LAATAGIVAISYDSRNSFPKSTYIGDVDVGSMEKSDAMKKIRKHFSDIFATENLTLIVNGNKEYKIPYDSIDMDIDEKATVHSMESWKTVTYITGLIRTYFGHEKLVIQPVLSFNEGKLRQALIELSDNINIQPIDASISIENGKIAKRAETAGYLLNIDNAINKIRNHLSNDFDSTIYFDKKDNFEIQSVNPKIMLKEYADIEHVISEYSTEISDDELLSSIQKGAQAINGIILDKAGNGGLPGGSFSFLEYLKAAETDFENDNEGYDQVASTLYGALLELGIDKKAIARAAHKLAPEYVEPGLDAWISGNGNDLKFNNTLGHKIALFAAVEGSRLTVRIAGSLKDKVQDFDIKVLTVQKFDPPVVNIENRDLKPGEKVMLTPGKDGLLVKVFRNNELISTDKYDAEKEIIQIGPGTDWEAGNNENK